MHNDTIGFRLRCAKHRTVALEGRFDWSTDPVDTETRYINPCRVCATEIGKAQDDIACLCGWFPADWQKAQEILEIRCLLQVGTIDFEVTVRETDAQGKHRYTEIKIDRALVRTFGDVGAGLRGEIALYLEGLRLTTQEATGGKRQP
jgi:hypothetical protein